MSKPSGRRVQSTTKALARTNNPLPAPNLDRVISAGNDAALVPRSAAQLADSFQNLVAGIGAGRDKRIANRFGIVCQLTRIELEAMYRGNWVAARIVDALAEDATREWVNLSWDGRDADQATVKSIQTAEDDFELRDKTTEVLKWTRLYGGAGIVVGIKGQNDWSQPLNLESIKKGSLELLHVVDRWRLAATGEIDSDRSSRNFGKPKYFTIAEAATDVERIHWTRVILFHGKRIPYFEWQRNGRWHDSVLQTLAENVKDYEATRAGIASMVFESHVDIMAIPDLVNLLSQPGGAQKVIDRVNMGAAVKSMNNVWLIDGGDSDGDGEKITQKTITFSGVNEVFEKVCMYDICGAAGMSMTRMFGRSPAGLNSTGSGDEKNDNKLISNYQMSELRRPLMRLYEILVRSTIGSMPKNFAIEFKPLAEASDAEDADTGLKRAQRDKIYVEMGAVHEGVIARELKDDNVYRTLEDKDVEMAEELALDPDPIPPAPGAVPPAAGGRPGAPPAPNPGAAPPPAR